MNKNILNAVIVGSFAMGLASCDENSWNDHYLDGFEGGVDYENSIEATYTLTDADYKTVSTMMEEVATTDAEKSAAKAIASNLYFEKEGVYSAPVALPAFFKTSSFPYYLASNGSTVDVTYREAAEVPAELTALAGAKSYTISATDYATAWGSETAFIRSYAPDATAASNIPTALAGAFADAEDGMFAVVTYNNATQNPMFGLPDEVPASADLYTASEFKAGKDIIADVAGSRVATDLGEKTYGYLPSADVTVSADEISGYDAETQVWNFVSTGTEGEFYMMDGQGRYYYQSGTYNSFNVSSTLKAGDDGYVWIITPEADHAWKITNKYANKWVQTPSGTYSTWGSYNYVSGTYPCLFVPNEEASTPVEIPLYTPVSVTENAVYMFNGGKWAVADGVVALNPADYTAMGFNNNSLVDADIYIPLFLKSKRPYAQDGDQMYVVYNRNKVDLFVYDGSAWTLNNNGLETVTGRYIKKNNEWSFVKYVGKAIFVEFKEAEVELDRNYLFVAGDICATPISKSSSYGYLPVASVAIKDGQIIEKSDANAFTFASSYEDENEVITKAPEGKFMLVDSNGRYIYMTGTYNSVNLSAAPSITDGVIADGYLWTATPNEDGSWKIVNAYSGKTMAYSTNYGSFGIYASMSDFEIQPALYILE